MPDINVLELKTMSKEEAISDIRKVFKGNKKFINLAEIMIMSTKDFKRIDSWDIVKDDWNWEKLLRVTINFGKNGFKTLTYRKGNKKYAPENMRYSEGNTTSKIHDYSIFSFEIEDGKEIKEEFTWNAE